MATRGAAALAGVAVLAFLASACGNGLFKQYEYEEDLYLSLDGSATLYVNSSVAAHNALRGTAFDSRPSARMRREGIAAYFSSPFTKVERVTFSRRAGRSFIHVRIGVPDVSRLASAGAFAWSTYAFRKNGELFEYRQVVGSPPKAEALEEHDQSARHETRWTGEELVAVRLHLPSRIAYHNAPAENYRRGNILVWEQTLAARLNGAPISIEARMEAQSILYRTLFLFGATLVAAALAFGLAIWWVLRRGTTPLGPSALKEA